jgi:hypothetical protein
MSQHPTELELELMRGGEGEASLRQHVDACSDCQRQLTELERFASALSAPPPRIEVPAARDQAVLELARARAVEVRGQVRKTSAARRLLYWAGPIAAAAGIAILVTVPMRAPEEAPPPATDVAGDFNADGQVDIVDALLLARASERGETLDARFDLNGDQRVDRQDAEQIARVAVSVGGGSR